MFYIPAPAVHYIILQMPVSIGQQNNTGSSVQEIVIHPNDPNIIWAIRSNYNAGEKVYKSINNGTSWTNISGNLPNLPANCIIYQVGTQDGLYVGMDVGIYYKDNTMANWELYNANLPNVRVRDLKIKIIHRKYLQLPMEEVHGNRRYEVQLIVFLHRRLQFSL